MLWAPLKPCQVAYYVEDARTAALAHNAAFGSGPFFVFDHVPLVWSEHRGRRVAHDHTSAYGQWGDKMIEFVQQHGDDPSAFHDLYPQGSGHFGFHHVASFVSRLDPAIAHCSENGMPLVQLSETATGTRYAFVDARSSLGHMIELYEPSAGLTDFYEMVADAARHWDGKDPIRKLN